MLTRPQVDGEAHLSIQVDGSCEFTKDVHLGVEQPAGMYIKLIRLEFKSDASTWGSESQRQSMRRLSFKTACHRSLCFSEHCHGFLNRVHTH